MVADLLALFIMEAIPVDEIKLIIGDSEPNEDERVTLKKYIKDKGVNWLYDRLKKYMEGKIGYQAPGGIYGNYKKYNELRKNIMDLWVKYSSDDKRMKICIDGARMRWRSVIDIALAEI